MKLFFFTLIKSKQFFKHNILICFHQIFFANERMDRVNYNREIISYSQACECAQFFVRTRDVYDFLYDNPEVLFQGI